MRGPTITSTRLAVAPMFRFCGRFLPLVVLLAGFPSLAFAQRAQSFSSAPSNHSSSNIMSAAKPASRAVGTSSVRTPFSSVSILPNRSTAGTRGTNLDEHRFANSTDEEQHETHPPSSDEYAVCNRVAPADCASFGRALAIECFHAERAERKCNAGADTCERNPSCTGASPLRRVLRVRRQPPVRPGRPSANVRQLVTKRDAHRAQQLRIPSRRSSSYLRARYSQFRLFFF